MGPKHASELVHISGIEDLALQLYSFLVLFLLSAHTLEDVSEHIARAEHLYFLISTELKGKFLLHQDNFLR